MNMGIQMPIQDHAFFFFFLVSIEVELVNHMVILVGFLNVEIIRIYSSV